MGRDVDLLVWSNVWWGMGNGFYTYLLPLYVAQLGATPEEIGAVLALVNAVRVLVYLPAGLLADRFALKPVMLAGWVLGPAAMAAYWLAGTLQQVIPAVLLFGAVEICGPAYQSYITRAAPAAGLARAFTWMFVGATAGATLSAPLGGWMAQTAGLRTLFLGAFAAYAVSTVFVARLRPLPALGHGTVAAVAPGYSAGTGGTDGAGTRGAGAGVPEEQSVVSVPEGRPSGPHPEVPQKRARHAQRSAGTRLGGWSAAVAAVGAGAAQTPRRARGDTRTALHRRRLVPAALAEVWSGPLAAAVALTVGLYAAANLAQPLAPNWLADRYGFATGEIGTLGGISALGGAVFALAVGRLPERRADTLGLAAAALALALHGALLLVAGTWPVAAAAYALRGAFGTLPSLTVALLAREQAGRLAGSRQAGGRSPRMGLAFGLQRSAGAAALTISTAGAGWLYGVAPPLPFLVSALVLGVLAAAPWLRASGKAGAPLGLRAAG